MVSRKNPKWIRTRHKVVRRFLWPYFYLTARFKYHAKIVKYDGPDEPMVVLFNHVTSYDQFFVSLSFKQPVYYVAMEDLFSNGFLSKLLSYLVAPIPIKKHSTDLHALKTIISVAKEGGTIAIAPEGNRTYSGRTGRLKSGTISLIKKLNLPVALYKITNGYGVKPRWSDSIRGGRMYCGITRIIRPDEYKDLSTDELSELVKKVLYTDEAKDTEAFSGKAKAEYLERCMYVCPDCGLSRFKSSGNTAECLTCGKKIKYCDDTHIEGVGFEFPYRFLADWYDHQEAFVNGLDPAGMCDKPVYEDRVNVFDVVPKIKKRRISKGTTLKLYGDRVEFDLNGQAKSLSFDKVIGAACVGDNRLNMEQDGKLFLFKGDKRFNPLKYVNFYYRYNNLHKGDGDGKFLGL